MMCCYGSYTCVCSRQDPSELKLAHYGLEGDAGATKLNMKGNCFYICAHMSTRLHPPGLLSLAPNKMAATLSEVVQHLEQLYCGTMTIETAQIEVSSGTHVVRDGGPSNVRMVAPVM